MIIIGETPEKNIFHNKFIAPQGEGLRGRIIAMHKSKKQAIIVCTTSAFNDDIKYGDKCLVMEVTKDNWPLFVKKINGLPHTDNPNNWEWVMAQVFHGKGVSMKTGLE